MQMKLKGDYFGGQFHLPISGGVQEKILKRCPGDLDQVLWEANISYEHIDAVIESSIKGFETWRKMSFETRIGYLKKYQEIVRAKKKK